MDKYYGLKFRTQVHFRGKCRVSVTLIINRYPRRKVKKKKEWFWNSDADTEKTPMGIDLNIFSGSIVLKGWTRKLHKRITTMFLCKLL